MRRAEGGHSAHDILESANWLLTGFNYAGRSLTFIETNREILVSSSFIDGRAPLSMTGRLACIDLDEAAEWTTRGGHPAAPVRTWSRDRQNILDAGADDRSGARLRVLGTHDGVTIELRTFCTASNLKTATVPASRGFRTPPVTRIAGDPVEERHRGARRQTARRVYQTARRSRISATRRLREF